MTDPDLENLKSFYSRIIRESDDAACVGRATFYTVDMPDPETVAAYTEADYKIALATCDYFEKERTQYYLSELQTAKQEEARVGMYLNGGFTGEQWPEDFEVEKT